MKQSELPVVWVQARQIDESKIKQVELLSSVEKVVSKKKGFANIVRLDKTDGRINLETITDNQLVTVTEGSLFLKENKIRFGLMGIMRRRIIYRLEIQFLFHQGGSR
ncbi:hypothetical protein [uncultured Streptococcus sp.]|uniref:hypothetical protein n=1 Tax=uncultured Streptococcus sp. TaxID=83427 RepID=UPI0028D241AA|nr:hypothetical protein [uncultured Streptococcus sp.]